MLSPYHSLWRIIDQVYMCKYIHMYITCWQGEGMQIYWILEAMRNKYKIHQSHGSPTQTHYVMGSTAQEECAVLQYPQASHWESVCSWWVIKLSEYGCSKSAGIPHLQMVREKLVCHAVIGTQKGKSLVMTVTVICEFVAPVIQLSTKQLVYRLEKVSGAVLGRDGCSSCGLACSQFNLGN